MTEQPLHYKTLLHVSDLIQRGEVTSAFVTQEMLNRIAAVDQEFLSYVHVCADRALAQAGAADEAIAKGIVKGPLNGVPIAVKDLCYTTYAPTRAGTTIHKDFIASHNATVVDRLEAAGAVILGKLTMTEAPTPATIQRFPHRRTLGIRTIGSDPLPPGLVWRPLPGCASALWAATLADRSAFPAQPVA